MKKTTWVVFLSLFVFSCSAHKHRVLSIAGSDTILELIQAQAELFFAKTGIPVNVTGGGSGVGITLVREKSIDIANASRELTPDERTPSLVQLTVANDLISVVVNDKNPIHNLSREQLQGIYSGRIRNWKELGWKNIPISLYGRQSSSGTYQYFQKVILDKKDYSPMVKEMTGNSQLVRSLKEDIAGIAYVAFGYYYPQKEFLNLVSVNGITPSLNKDMRDYILARGVYEIFNKTSKKISLIRRWFNFILGEEGKKQIYSMGFLPLSSDQLKEDKKNMGII